MGEDTPAELINHWEWFHSVVRRFFGEAACKSPRPPMAFRRASRWFIVALKANLRRLTGQGLEQYVTDLTPEKVRRPREQAAEEEAGTPPAAAQPHRTLTLCIDQHSVGWSAVQFLTFHCHLAVQAVHDPNHRAWNDMKLAFSAVGAWPTVFLLMHIFNVNYGPWQGAS